MVLRSWFRLLDTVNIIEVAIGSPVVTDALSWYFGEHWSVSVQEQDNQTSSLMGHTGNECAQGKDKVSLLSLDGRAIPL